MERRSLIKGAAALALAVMMNGNALALDGAELYAGEAKLYEAARKEGMAVSFDTGPEWANWKSLFRDFKKRYPDIELTYNDIGSAATVVALDKTRRRPQADTAYYFAASGADAAAKDVVAPFQPVNFDKLPAVFKEPSGKWFTIHTLNVAFLVNKKLVKNVPTSWNDLLRPEYKSSVVYLDPRSTGVGQVIVFAAAYAAGGGVAAAGIGLGGFGFLQRHLVFAHAQLQQGGAHGLGALFGQLGIEGGVARGIVKAADHGGLAGGHAAHDVGQRLFRALGQVGLAGGEIKLHHAFLHLHGGAVADHNRLLHHGGRRFGLGFNRPGRRARAIHARLQNGAPQGGRIGLAALPGARSQHAGRHEHGQRQSAKNDDPGHDAVLPVAGAAVCKARLARWPYGYRQNGFFPLVWCAHEIGAPSNECQKSANCRLCPLCPAMEVLHS